MSTLNHRGRAHEMTLDRSSLQTHQLQRLGGLLADILPANQFYASRFGKHLHTLTSLEALRQLPFTKKEDLLPQDAEGLPANLTFPLEEYVRYHQTSGSRGHPLPVLDTREDWQWWIHCWQYVLDSAQITAADRGLLAFSFGPFIGFWSAHDALLARGAMSIPGGGLSSLARLELAQRTGATALFCTPTYALRLVEVAHENRFDLGQLQMRSIVVAGEPGGSLPSLRARIQDAFGAEVVDHAGASEVGAWGFADRERRGLHILETEFIAEFLDPQTDQPVAAGQLAHLVLTTLGRSGAPVIRYRTGDLVRPTWPDSGPCRFVLLEGGVLGRVDDMMIVRGVNVFPSSIEEILRGFPDVVEYRLTAARQGEMDALSVEVEDARNDPARIAHQLQLRLGLRVDVRCVPPGSLPRYEAKARRFVDLRRDQNPSP